MIRNVYLTLVFLLAGITGAIAQSQSGSIKGKIFDKATKEPMPFTVVVAEMNGTQAGGATSDFDGNFLIKPLSPGSYTIKVSSLGYADLVITDVLVKVDAITFQDLGLTKKVVETQEVIVEGYKIPLIDKGNTQTGATLTREEIEAAPTRDVRSVAAISAGVLQKDEGDDINVRGSRTEATDYYVDGIRIRGSNKLPQAGIEQATVIVGGTPAQYGDATGGIVSVTTRGPSSQWNGGLEFVTSELTDEYGYNLVSANFSGPILKKKLEGGAEKAILGVFVSGEYQLDKDPDPSAIGMYRLKDNVYNQLASNPVVPYQTGPTTFGFYNVSQFYHADAFEKVKAKDNVDQTGYRFTAKFDYQPLDNTTFTVGGSWNTNDRSSWVLNRAMYNSEENPQIKDVDYRVFGRVTQRLASTYKGGEENASVFRNVYFTLQGEYSKNLQVNQDPDHKDNFWRYGWFGRFENSRTSAFGQYAQEVDGSGNTYNIYAPVYTNNYTFAPVGVNTLPEQYNVVAYDFWQSATGSPTFNNLNEIRGPGGLRNGDGAASVMAIWEAIGNQRNLYQDFDNDQFRFTFAMNADVKNHQLRIGAEFEQRIDRGYSLAPRGLWTIGRQLASQYFSSTDFTNLLSAETLQVDPTTFTVNNTFATGYTGNANSKGFYENLRDAMGVSYNTWVDLDALNADNLSMGLFTPDELLVSNVLGYYYGYDYKGEKFSGNPTFKDFFTKQQNGVYTREIGAFRPTYSALYIQDQFAIENLNFNVGLRVDRFDANQKALKDQYLLVDAYTVGELPGGIANKPGNIGDDFVPYLATAGDYTSVIGYRDGSVWYDANGQIVSNPDLIAQQSSSSVILPAVKPTAGTLASSNWDIDAIFEDYEPQISVMPRIAFAFSITDQAQFFAHYDVLTQRPTSNLRNDPIEYLALVTNPDGVLNNSNLKPEKTTDYELGFKQVLGKTSALTISAFYREMQNMIQITKLNFAYPNTYRSYGNIDFGTVKGMSLAYDLRRTGNVRMLASYTLQFADGTGSGANSNVELTDTDQPNIRFMVPLDFDQRHQFTASVDYRYGEGTAYNGPLLWGKPFLENTGVNFIFKANSGTPYTRQARPTREAAAIGWQDNGQRVVEGVINSARTPWQFRIDMRLEKDFGIKFNEKKTGNFNVYLWITNLLDTRNVITVYRATGNPDDDGFINSPDGQQLTASQVDQQAFVDQYNIRVFNPDHYSLPRRARIGVRFDF
jgi:outer membrane receptor protein involved in Fe transport